MRWYNLGYSQKIKCKNCGYEDKILHTDDIIERPGEITWGSTTFISKKSGYIIHINNNELSKYADKKFCAFDIKNKDKYEWTKDFKISDLKCPKCRKKDFEIINELET